LIKHKTKCFIIYFRNKT